MEQNKNSESGRHRWEDWGGQDSSLPDEPYEPGDASLPGQPAPQAAPGDGLTPEETAARRRQGLTGPPRRTGTGLFYDNGDEIPPTHPDHGPMHLLPRQEDGSFASYYYCSHEELDDFDIDAPPPRRHRRDGFSPERQQEFVEHYRNTASLIDAARLTGISRSTAYNLLNSPDAAAFRAAIEEAGRGTDVILEATALERAVNGQEEIVFYKGQRVGVRIKYDNKLLMSLLRARNPLKYAPLSEIEGWLARRGIAPPADVEGALDRLAAAEAEWGRGLPGEGGQVAMPAAASRSHLAMPADSPRLEAPPRPAHGPEGPRQDPSPPVRPEPVEGRHFYAPSEQEEERASTGSARTDGAEKRAPNNRADASTLSSSERAAEHALASTSSTSEDEAPAQASTSSTSAADLPAQASTSSTSDADLPAQASNLSTLEAEPPGAADEPGLPTP